jgi:hypothetical protein
MTPLEFDFLCACHEAVLRQTEMVPLLANDLGVPADKVFYHWAITRCKNSGRLANTDWTYWFHGLECELENRKDHRFLRIDFAPGGRYDSFTPSGVMKFVLAGKPPWKEYPELRSYLSKPIPQEAGVKGPASVHLSGSHVRVNSLCISLEAFIEKAGYPHAGSEPPKGWGIDRPEFWDKMLANRIRLTERGKNLVLERRREPS